MKTPLTPLAARIKARANELEKSVSRISKEMGRGKDGLRDIMRGRSVNPRSDTLQLLAAALGWDLKRLLDGIEPSLGAPPDGELATAGALAKACDQVEERRRALNQLIDQGPSRYRMALATAEGLIHDLKLAQSVQRTRGGSASGRTQS